MKDWVRTHRGATFVAVVVVIVAIWTAVDQNAKSNFKDDAEVACREAVEGQLISGYNPELTVTLEEELATGGLVFDVLADDNDGQWNCSAEKINGSIEVNVADGLWEDVG